MSDATLSTIQALLNSLEVALNRLPKVDRFCVAFSGGRDSHILLHALTQLSLNIPVFAVHINHGLSTEAAQWEAHCKAICEALHVPYISQNITQALQALQNKFISSAPTQGLEADARTLRYQALAALLQSKDCLLTAHHQEDQAETLLLQLIRGSGISGLASMPFLSRCGSATHARPLLQWTKENREVYAHYYNLQWIEDSSNQNLRFARNFIRHEVLPLLKKRWESSVKTLARTAKHCASTADLLSELAEEDLCTVTVSDRILSIHRLLKLSFLRRQNALRYWLKHTSETIPSEAQLAQLEQLLRTDPSRSASKMTWKGVTTIRRYRDHLYLLTTPTQSLENKIHIKKWDLASPYVLEGWGTLYAKPPSLGQGLCCTTLTGPPVEIRFRQGGERFHPKGRSGSHPLKKLFQEWGIPPWERAYIPLLYQKNQLLAVAHYAVAHSLAAKPNELGVCIEMTRKRVIMGKNT